MSGKQKQELLHSSPVFCMAPFTSLHINIEGKVFPCCNSAGFLEEKLGNLQENTSLEVIWNSEKIKQLRLNMLMDKAPVMCAVCRQDEHFKKVSLRQIVNTEYAQYFERIHEILPDGTLPHSKVLFLDIRFSNLCNFSCRICSHYFSSRWFDEAKNLHLLAHNGNRISYAASDMETFMQQVKNLLPFIEKIHFAGGEPLISAEHYEVLLHLIQLKRTDVQLSYNTNFSVLSFKNHSLTELWKQFKHVQISASLDGMGKRAELMRKGQIWHEAETHRQKLLLECPHIDFAVNSAVSILNIWHLPHFYENWVNAGFIGVSDIDVYVVREPSFFDIRRLPETLKQEITRKYEQFITAFSKTHSQFNQKTKGQLQYLTEYMNSAQLPMLPEFYTHTNKLNEFRNENFIEVFPELTALF